MCVCVCVCAFHQKEFLKPLTVISHLAVNNGRLSLMLCSSKIFSVSNTVYLYLVDIILVITSLIGLFVKPRSFSIILTTNIKTK